ncbi:MAG: hypothetical protein AAF182_04135, partial [Pseudomonadota bacterium]
IPFSDCSDTQALAEVKHISEVTEDNISQITRNRAPGKIVVGDILVGYVGYKRQPIEYATVILGKSGEVKTPIFSPSPVFK